VNVTAKTTRRKLEKQCDKLVQIAGLQLCGGRCIGYSESCTTTATEMHHICGRRTFAEARHEMRNLVPCCDICHRAIEDDKRLFLGWLMIHLPAHYEFHYVITRGELPRTTVDGLRATVVKLRGMVR